MCLRCIQCPRVDLTGHEAKASVKIQDKMLTLDVNEMGRGSPPCNGMGRKMKSCRVFQIRMFLEAVAFLVGLNAPRKSPNLTKSSFFDSERRKHLNENVLPGISNEVLLSICPSASVTYLPLYVLGIALRAFRRYALE